MNKKKKYFETVHSLSTSHFRKSIMRKREAKSIETYAGGKIKRVCWLTSSSRSHNAIALSYFRKFGHISIIYEYHQRDSCEKCTYFRNIFAICCLKHCLKFLKHRSTVELEIRKDAIQENSH